MVAVILWNTRYVQFAAEDLVIGPETTKHVAPLGWEDLSLTGDYAWDAPDQLRPDELRQLASRALLDFGARSLQARAERFRLLGQVSERR